MSIENVFSHYRYTKPFHFAKRNTDELNKEEKNIILNYVSETSSKSITENNEGTIGAKRSISLGKTILDKEYPWNIDTDGETICIENLKEF